MSLLASFILIPIIFLVLYAIIFSIIIKWSRGKAYSTAIRVVTILPLVIIFALVYRAFYPSKKFYKEEYFKITGLNFPEKGKVLYRCTSYPDHFGDYTASFLVKLDTHSLLELEQFTKFTGFIEGSMTATSEQQHIEKKANPIYLKQYYKEDIDTEYFLGFLSQTGKVILTRASY